MNAKDDLYFTLYDELSRVCDMVKAGSEPGYFKCDQEHDKIGTMEKPRTSIF